MKINENISQKWLEIIQKEKEKEYFKNIEKK